MTARQPSDERFVKTPFVETIVSRALSYLAAGYPVHFQGPTGIGKTTLAWHVAEQLGRPITVIRGHHELDNADLIGGFSGYLKKQVIDNFVRTVYKKEEEVKSLWTNGQLIEAVREGHVLIYDEFTRSRPETNNLFLSLLEERVLPLYGSLHRETHIPCHPSMALLFTSNPQEYAGVFPTQEALLDRMITINLSLFDEETELEILLGRTEVSQEVAEFIVELVAGVRRICLQNDEVAPSLRASLMIAKIVQAENLDVQPDDLTFRAVCFDVLSPFLQRCSESEQESELDQKIRKLVMGGQP